MAPRGYDTSATTEAVFKRTAARYRPGDRFTRFYVGSKLRRDPIHADLLALGTAEPFGRVADVGCGRGQLAVALLVAGCASAVEGCDYAAAALGRARAAAAGLNFTAREQDLAADQTVPACDTVLLVDVLYLLGRPAALALLAAAAAAARSRVLVRTHDPALGWRGRLTVVLERWLRPMLPNTGRRVDPVSPALVVAALRDAGFAVSAAPCWRGTPFSNVLVVARRVARSSVPAAACLPAPPRVAP